MLAGFLFCTSGQSIELEVAYLAPVANKTILMEIPPQGVEIVERRGRMGEVCGCSVPRGQLRGQAMEGKLGYKPSSRKKYKRSSISLAKDEFIKQNYTKMTIVQLSEQLRICANSVGLRMKKLGILSYRTRESIKKDAFIRENSEEMTSADMAKQLGITESAVRKRARRMRLTVEGKRRKESIKRDTFIRENYEEKTLAEMGKQLGITESAVQQRAKRMGLRKKPL